MLPEILTINEGKESKDAGQARAGDRHLVAMRLRAELENTQIRGGRWRCCNCCEYRVRCLYEGRERVEEGRRELQLQARRQGLSHVGRQEHRVGELHSAYARMVRRPISRE